MTPPRITGAVADDRGAAAIMIAVAMLAIVGFMAFAIDPGVLFQERRELQVGAEAAALAIAQDCATGAIGCSETDDGGFAKQYVDANASDGEARVVNIDIDTSAGTVTVEAGTLNNASNRDGDPNTTDLFFGPAVGVDAFEVRASAEATWGAVGGGTTLPLIFGECEYVQAGGNLDAGIQPTGTMIIGFHFGANNGNGNGDDDDDDDPCFFNNGQDIDDDEDRLPGGFGWLQQTGCEATLGVDNYVDAKRAMPPRRAAAPRTWDWSWAISSWCPCSTTSPRETARPTTLSPSSESESRASSSPATRRSGARATGRRATPSGPANRRAAWSEPSRTSSSRAR